MYTAREKEEKPHTEPGSTERKKRRRRKKKREGTFHSLDSVNFAQPGRKRGATAGMDVWMWMEGMDVISPSD